jgi:hypothetical protein
MHSAISAPSTRISVLRFHIVAEQLHVRRIGDEPDHDFEAGCKVVSDSLTASFRRICDFRGTVHHPAQSPAGSTWVLRSSGAAAGDVMNLIIARAASDSFEPAINATLDGQGLFRNPGSAPTYSVPGAPTMMLVC